MIKNQLSSTAMRSGRTTESTFDFYRRVDLVKLKSKYGFEQMKVICY